MNWTLLVALALSGLLWGAVSYRRTTLRRQAGNFLGRFDHLPTLGAYREGLSRSWFGGPRVDHAVLLIHGFSASPAAFAPLLEELQRLNIPYIAPALTGSGLDDFNLLESARVEDWRRDVHIAYDQLAGLAREVSVVAISFGTLIAAELAQERPVRHLVLVAPYFYLKSERDRRMRALLARPAVRALARVLVPMVPKPIRPGRTEAGDITDPVSAARFFQYPTLPLRGLLAVWDYPSHFALERLKCATLDVLHGAKDETSDVPSFLAELSARGVTHRARAFERSGHNLFSDTDAGEAALAAAKILAGHL